MTTTTTAYRRLDRCGLPQVIDVAAATGVESGTSEKTTSSPPIFRRRCLKNVLPFSNSYCIRRILWRCRKYRRKIKNVDTFEIITYERYRCNELTQETRERLDVNTSSSPCCATESSSTFETMQRPSCSCCKHVWPRKPVGRSLELFIARDGQQTDDGRTDRRP